MQQFFCILHFCHTCSLCRVELVEQFPARVSAQVLLCIFPGVLWLWNFLYSVGPHPVPSLYIYTFVVSQAFMAGAASQAGDADSSRAPELPSGLWMSTVIVYCWCHSDSAAVLLYFTWWWIRYQKEVVYHEGGGTILHEPKTASHNQLIEHFSDRYYYVSSGHR